MGSKLIVVQIVSDVCKWKQAFDALEEYEDKLNLSLVKVSTAKKAVKFLRKNSETAVIVVPAASSNHEELNTLSHTIRGVMHNETIRIVVCAEDAEITGSRLVDDFGVNAVLLPGDDSEDRLRSQVSAELHTYSLLTGTNSRHQAEKDLLSAIARFSRLEMKLSECLSEFARSMGLLTGAVLVNVIVVRRDGSLKRSSVTFEREGIDAKQWLDSNRSPVSQQLQHVVKEARLRMQLQLDDPEHIAAGNAFGCEVAGRFIVPLRSFGRTMCLVECWLPIDGLQEIPVDLVRSIEKSSEQFSLLFERKQADSELKRQYSRLKHTLEELTSTKEALYHSDKLASLGQLAAGIAHEINNPVAYVMGNFNPLNDYVDSMTNMLDLHNRFVAQIDSADVDIAPELREQITKLGDDLDMEYVMEDVRSLVKESKDGLKRVREIVINLNEFARKDSVDTEPANLNAGLEATLRILENELKYGVNVLLDLGELPEVMCQPGLIKQVLLNLIKNGAQAMGGKGDMHISTGVEDGFAVIRVRDCGTGVPPEALEKIFDPFFTTKPVGEGTGLGLSLSHGIVKRHNGTLEVVETGASGTEFRLAIPLGAEHQPIAMAKTGTS